MSKHLTEEQFATCFVEGASGAAWEHLAECSACQSELDRLGSTVSSLRHAIRNRVDNQVPSSVAQPAPVRRPKVAWAAAVAATLILGTLPLLLRKPQEIAVNTAEETSPEVLMNAINLHLSRTMPSPMEPMLSLIPSDLYLTESGEIQ
jgi:hypothetical protein